MYHSLLLRAISDGGQKYIWYLDRPLNSCWNQLRSTTGSWLTWYPFPNPMNPKTKTKTRGAFIFSATFKMTVTESLPSKRFYRHTCLAWNTGERQVATVLDWWCKWTSSPFLLKNIYVYFCFFEINSNCTRDCYHNSWSMINQSEPTEHQK